MNQITELPDNDYEFGYDFNYALWAPGTNLTLCNVPWNSDYRDIVYFPNHDALDQYLAISTVKTIQIDRVTLCKPNVPIRIEMPFSDAYKYNYIAVRNTMPAVKGTNNRFYYFITDVRYIAPNTTELVIQLDVWQTFCHDIRMGNAYVERGHIGIAETNQFDSYGRNYLTVPEGLDLGNEYIVGSVSQRDIANTESTGYSLMVVTTTDLKESGGDLTNPVLKMAKGSVIEGLPSGCDVWIFSPGGFKSFLGLKINQPWITRGILSVTAIPYIDPQDPNNGVYSFSSAAGFMTEVVTFEGSIKGTKIVSVRSNHRVVVVEEDFRKYFEPNPLFSKLKKFQTYPYSVIEMTSYTGTPLILKPECIPTQDFRVHEFIQIANPNPRIVWSPFKYNSRTAGTVGETVSAFSSDLVADGGEYLDMQTGIMNFPQLPILNDSYFGYMASNANSISYQYSAADWSQQRALQRNEVDYNQAAANQDLIHQLNVQGVNAANEQMVLANNMKIARSGLAVANNAATGLLGGKTAALSSVSGMINNTADMLITTEENTRSTAISNNMATQGALSRINTAGYVRDTNKDYADFAAKGDYQNQIAGINAKVQDAKMLQPTVSGQIGGEAFNISRIGWGLRVKYKRLQPAIEMAIGNFWLRYGYAINRFIRNLPQNYQVMTKFTYWKLKETYIISASCPETYKQTIRGIFEKGVTVWNRPQDIGNISIYDNEPIPGRYIV